MKPFRRSGLSLALFVFAACERSKAPPPAETTVVRPLSPADSAVAATTRNWDSGAGPVLLVAAGSPSAAFVITPDSTNAASQLAALPRPASVTLFGRGGTVQSAELPAVADSNGCAVSTLSGAPPPKPWSIGFVGGVVAPVRLDSTQALSPADSASFVVGVTRLASSLPNDSAGRFIGLPFVVRTIWRFQIPDGPTVVVATLTRQINQEATPLQEHTLLVAEKAANDTSMTMGYSERSYGAEETIESSDLLAAALIGSSRTPALILSRDYGDATAYALVERSDNGQWKPRWRSARRRC